MIQTVGIVGYGHFGQFVALMISELAPDVTVKVHSARFAADAITFFSLEEVAACDAVILCGAIRDFEKQVVAVVPHLGPQTIVIDVATVKLMTTEVLRNHLGDRPFIAAHPMFGPESFKKNGRQTAGLKIVVTDYILPNDQYVFFKSFITGLGFDLLEMTADEHDCALADTLFLTHLIGQTIANAGFSRTGMDTVSFGFLMDAVESVQNDTELFKDVYRYNPYCQAVVERLDAAEKSVIKNILKAE